MRTQDPHRAGRWPPAATIALALLLLAGCRTPLWNSSDRSPAGAPVTPGLSLTGPRDGAIGVPVSSEIAFTVAGVAPSAVTVALVDAGGVPVLGELRAGGASWVPLTPLEYETAYAVTVAAGAPGARSVARATFTTMAAPANLVDVHSWIGDDEVVGVAMPVVVTFGRAVPRERRAAVQRRLFVRTTPAQEGVWNWFNGKEVHYRPRAYWQPGTKLDVRIGTGGLPWLGEGVSANWYGRHDLTVHALVGVRLTIDVDNRTKKMTVTRNGKVLRRIPVSLGRPGAPSSTGRLMVMSRNEWEWFDSSTYGVPVDAKDGYRTRVSWVFRLTWGGEYIHAAPWSTAEQGVRNVSHGCVNVSTEAATWLFGIAKVGDPVTVRNTQRHVKWGDGWTDWDLPWSEYVRGSAIPYVPPSATPSVRPS